MAGNTTAPCHRDSLENELSVYLEDMPLATGGGMLSQHDGAPKHFAKEINVYM
jgi:hypothetical protein